jgi:uncharacterized protein
MEEEVGISLLVLQSTPFCNIDCSYCYLADRKSTAVMSLETLRKTCRLVFGSSLVGEKLEVAWHGGEPLVVPPDWYCRAIDLMIEERPTKLQLSHRFQTNGLLINQDWLRFFSQTNARLGLSIDGPAEIHDVHRRTRRGHGTHADAMRAVRLLQDYDIDFHVISVLTERSLRAPEELFRFYVDNGIKNVGFNVEEIEAAHRNSSLAKDGVDELYRQFIRRFFSLVWDSGGLIKVREFESTLGALLSDEQVVDQQNNPFAIITVSVDGHISTFSPELLGAKHPRFAGFLFGDVALQRDLSEFGNTANFRAIRDEIRKGLLSCQQNCSYFRWCGGGAPVNKLFETGRFDTTETMHCRLTRQIVIDEVLECIEARAYRKATKPSVEQNA